METLTHTTAAADFTARPPRPFYDSPVCTAGWNSLMAACKASADRA